MALNLLAHEISVQISGEDNTSFFRRKVMDTKQQLPQLETYNKVEQQIKDTLDLDINELPRLKRGTVESVVILKRRQANKKES